MVFICCLKNQYNEEKESRNPKLTQKSNELNSVIFLDIIVHYCKIIVNQQLMLL